jgi:hypothetical protein
LSGDSSLTVTEDELDKISIEQLHAVVLELSKNCFELKRICATVLIAASTLLATFTNKRLDPSVFVGGLIVVSFFWVLDAQSYYYQEKVRARMKQLSQQRARRASPNVMIDGVGMPLPPTRTEETRRIRSLFNSSMLFYLLLAIIDLLVWILYALVSYALFRVVLPESARQSPDC